MTGKPVNLNKARKARAQHEALRVADQNAIKFGRAKAEKTMAKSSETIRQELLDQHRREDS